MIGTEIGKIRGVTGLEPQKNVLIVEDDPTYRHLWKRIINDLGVQNFWSVQTPDKAKAILEKGKPDLLISDVVLPGISGYDLAKLARKKYPAMEILLTTGYQTDLSRFDLEGLKCHLLHKPYHNLKDVVMLLKHLLNKENAFAGMDEDSFSDNEDFPEITEWTL